jgi:hypothetical protein
MKPSQHLPILLISAAFVAAACNPRDDRPAPTPPVPSDPAGTPAPSTSVPKLPDPKAPDGPPGRDSKASDPKGDLTSREESTAMPKPGQANNHSSPALDSSPSSSSK